MSDTIEELKFLLDTPFDREKRRRQFYKAFLFFLCATIAYSIIMALNGKCDSDPFFIVAAGREILQNGIPKYNIWIIDSGSRIVIQQWLYAVILAVIDKGNTAAYFAFMALQMCIFILLAQKFFSYGEVKKKRGLIVTLCLVLLFWKYIYSPRPELITLILLLLQCLALEHYKKNQKIWVLVFLPIIMLAEMNLHMSMWPLHFVILLVYMLPGIERWRVQPNSLTGNWLPLAITAIAMGAVTLINPYGTEGLMYIIKALAAKTFSYVKVAEVQKPVFASSDGICIVFVFLYGLFCFCKGKLRSETFYLLIIFIPMSFMAERNVGYLLLCMLFLFRDYDIFQERIFSEKLKGMLRKVPNAFSKYALAFLIITSILVAIAFMGELLMNARKPFNELANRGAYPSIYEKIQEDYSNNKRIFAGFNTGAYLEYMGMKNIYMDARPELYTENFNERRNILSDYAFFCMYGVEILENGERVGWTEELADEWMESYQFDYVIVDTSCEPVMHAYMEMRSDYDRVAENKNGAILLYEKVG